MKGFIEVEAVGKDEESGKESINPSLIKVKDIYFVSGSLSNCGFNEIVIAGFCARTKESYAGIKKKIAEAMKGECGD